MLTTVVVSYSVSVKVIVGSPVVLPVRIVDGVNVIWPKGPLVPCQFPNAETVGAVILRREHAEEEGDRGQHLDEWAEELLDTLNWGIRAAYGGLRRSLAFHQHFPGRSREVLSSSFTEVMFVLVLR